MFKKLAITLIALAGTTMPLHLANAQDVEVSEEGVETCTTGKAHCYL
ncbi:MAG: hypothetical protein AAF438_08560 [Pseudomonadota bacterium]